ncbi:MAG: glycosyltransferase family 2 protein [Dysgonamonadaceae bacterium]|jgi:GT2 family glycosyltransferase|nr:glycosyltransferase family 2 protein [Dysgonamonadaceae bacterium]
METKQDKTLAVVVTCNGVRWLDKCLGSLRNATLPVRTIVVDNASSDDTVCSVREHYPEAVLIENKTNQGFGRANNTGIRIALKKGAEFIYLLNQDAWVEPDVVEQLVRLMESHPDYGILSPMHYAGDGISLDEGFRQILPPGFGAGCSEIVPVEFVMAAHWLVRTAALKETGGFLPLFRHYGEDKNLIHRMIFHGWKTGIASRLKGFHDRKGRPESGEQTLQIQYGRYLAQSADINRPGRLWPAYFKEFLSAVVRTNAPMKVRLGYVCKAIGRIIPVVRYRYDSRYTDKTNFQWIM